MSAALQIETVDRRVLGGVAFVDSITAATVLAPVAVSSTTLRIRPNRSAVYVIGGAPGMGALTSTFNPVAAGWPTPQRFEIAARDPALNYLPRRAQVQVPQPLATASIPQAVTLYAGPSAPIAPNWAVVRVSVVGSAGAGLPWAVLRALRADNSVAATGMTDARGEGLLAVAGLGVQVSANASGAVTETTTAVTVQAWFDPGALTQPPGWIPNPDDILGDPTNPALRTGTQTGAIAAGQTLSVTITVPA